MIAEATIREALDARHAEKVNNERYAQELAFREASDQLLGDTPRTVVIDPRSCTSEFIPLSKAPPAGSLFEACVEAVDEAWGINASDDPPASRDLARAVIQILIDRTESPTTCAELTRILAGVV